MKTGLRAGELLALKWEDLDLVAGKLVVRRTLWHDQEGQPKGGRQRVVPLSTGATATLKAHRHLRGPYVFCDDEGGRLTHSVIKDVVPSTCKRAGLAKRITTHGFRHYPDCGIIPSGSTGTACAQGRRLERPLESAKRFARTSWSEAASVTQRGSWVAS
jgi:integrase